MYKTPTYSTWVAMKRRATGGGYWKYLDKQITMQESWKEFVNFYLDMGERPTELEYLLKDNKYAMMVVCALDRTPNDFQ